MTLKVLESLTTSMDKVKNLIHISDVHIRKRERHPEYQIVFDRLYKEVEKYPDSLVVITGDTVHDKTELVPESIDILRRFLISLTNLTEVVIIIGNHDVNIFNVGSLDSLSPIITDLRTQNKIHLLNEDKAYRFGRTNIVFGVTTIWAKEVEDMNQYDLTMLNDELDEIQPIKIALYHGMIHGCTLDNGIKALNGSRCTNSSYFNVSDFNSYDLALLGDVHKHQFLNADRTVAYAGSLIQQKRDEDLIEHGFILWDLENLTGEFKRIPSDYGMIEITVPDDVKKYVKQLYDGNQERAKKSGRLIPQYPNSIFPSKLDIKLKYSTIEARENFKKIYDLITNVLNLDIIRTSELMCSRGENGLEAGALREIIEFGRFGADSAENSTDTLIDAPIREAEKMGKMEKVDKMDKVSKVTKHKDTRSQNTVFQIGNDGTVLRAIMKFYDQQSDKNNSKTADPKTRELIRKEVSSLLKKIKYNYESDVKNIRLKSIQFDNMFIYLENNSIDFDLFEDIVGLNAGNFQGKSSFIDIVLYAIYGQCSRGKRFDILNISKKSMKSRIVLDVNGVEYVINRNSYINSRKNRDLKESVIFCEGGKDITADDRVKTHKLIESKICSYSDMINNSFVLQKNGSSFTDLTDRQKKDLLCKMARLDVFDRVFHEAKSRHFSHSQNFGKNVRKLDPLMNKYLNVQEIESILPKNKSKTASSESNQRKLDLIRDKIDEKDELLCKTILELTRNIKKTSSNLTELEKKESVLSTDQNYGEQIAHTVQMYDNVLSELDNVSHTTVKIMDDIYALEAELESVLDGNNLIDIQNRIDCLAKLNKNQIRVLNTSLLDLHTRLDGSDRTESDILNTLSVNRSELIRLQDRMIDLNRERDDIHNQITTFHQFKDRDRLIIEVVGKIERIEENIQDTEKKIQTNMDQIEYDQNCLIKLSDHEYNDECEQCMTNPITKNILHLETNISELEKTLKQLRTTVKKLNRTKEQLRFLEHNEEMIDCVDPLVFKEAVNRPKQINALDKIELSIKNKESLLGSETRSLRATIHNDEDLLNKVELNQSIRNDIDRTKREIFLIENDSELKSQTDKLKRAESITLHIQKLRTDLGRLGEKTIRLRQEANRFEAMETTIVEYRIKLIEHSNLQNTLECMRRDIRKMKVGLRKSEIKLSGIKSEQNEVKLDLGRFVDIQDGIQEELNSKLVLEHIKKLLDRSGLVDELLSKQIIPYLQRQINAILSDVGHYRINIAYKNQNVNIYKDNGLNISMSSGYESYLLDLVFRLSLVQINNHIRTDFLVIDEGFNACDTEHKNNIRDLLEYMRGFYSWILIVSHDDFIKSFYDQDIKILTVEGVDDEHAIPISGSKIINVIESKKSNGSEAIVVNPLNDITAKKGVIIKKIIKNKKTAKVRRARKN